MLPLTPTKYQNACCFFGGRKTFKTDILVTFFRYFIFQLQQFKEDNIHVGFGSGTLALEQAIEKTMGNIKWMAENKEYVLKWLTDEIA